VKIGSDVASSAQQAIVSHFWAEAEVCGFRTGVGSALEAMDHADADFKNWQLTNGYSTTNSWRAAFTPSDVTLSQK
jgi:hypothetical protein